MRRSLRSRQNYSLMLLFNRAISGFTLIEILVAMVVLALGLLGLAALQLMALRDNSNVYSYTQAMALSYEMADRIHANATVWRANVLPTPATSCDDNCNSVDNQCNVTEMAAYDYCVWQTKSQAELKNAVTVSVLISPVSDSKTCTGDSNRRCLIVTWPNANSNTAKFEMEITP